MKKLSLTIAALTLFSSTSAFAFGPTPSQCEFIQDPQWRGYCFALIGD